MTRARFTLPAVLFLTVGAVQAEEAAGPKKPLSAETMWQLRRLGEPALSPDGRWAALTVTAYDVKDDKGLTDLWLVPTTPGETARALTSHEAGDSNPAWSPDGRLLAFESKRGKDEETQIYVIPADGGEARRVTNIPTGAAAPRWFPDSRRLAFISRVWADLKTWDEQAKRVKERKDSKVSAKVWDKPRARHWDRLIDDREAHIYTIAVDGGEPQTVTFGRGRPLSQLDAGRGSYDIAPDGAEIAFDSDSDTSGIDPNYDVYAIASAGGAPRNLSADNPGDDSGPLYSPDGRTLAFGRQTVKGFYGDRVRLVLHDRRSGQNRVATEAWDRSVRGLEWSADSRSLVGSIDDAGHDRLYRIDAASGRPTPLTRERSFTGVEQARDGAFLVALRQSFTEPPTLVRVDPRSGDSVALSTFNDALLAQVEWGTYESVTIKGHAGADVQMWVNYPPGFDRSKRYPLFMLLHGGPHNGVTDGFLWRWNAQVFSGWGYVTAWPNFHGSSGFGQAFADSITEDWATRPYTDVMAASRWFGDQPWIDAQRTAAGGGSYGGYLASLILGRPHPFKALVAHAAVYDLYTQYAADFGAGKKRHGEFWERPAGTMEASSPHLGAPRFMTPTLVVHGGRDYRVPDTHGFELWQTLQNRGVRSRLVYYPDENHWVLKPQNSLHWYGAVREWIAEFIGAGAR
jgi:dipeptidyl aminopeptidase/acylaminoacyl peptidase